MPTSQRKRKAKEQGRKKVAKKCKRLSELWETAETPMPENSPVGRLPTCTSLPSRHNAIADNLGGLGKLLCLPIYKYVYSVVIIQMNQTQRSLMILASLTTTLLTLGLSSQTVQIVTTGGQ